MRAASIVLRLGLLSGALSGCVTGQQVQQPVTGQLSTDGGPPIYLQMSDDDVTLANSALDRALETRVSGATVRWHNPDSGNRGSITPVSTSKTADGVFCRRYQEELDISGQRATYTDTACRRRGGLWVPVSG